MALACLDSKAPHSQQRERWADQIDHFERTGARPNFAGPPSKSPSLDSCPRKAKVVAVGSAGPPKGPTR